MEDKSKIVSQNEKKIVTNPTKQDELELSNGDKIVFKTEYNGEFYADVLDTGVLDITTDEKTGKHKTSVLLGKLLRNYSLFVEVIYMNGGLKVDPYEGYLRNLKPSDTTKLLTELGSRLGNALGENEGGSVPKVSATQRIERR